MGTVGGCSVSQSSNPNGSPTPAEGTTNEPTSHESTASTWTPGPYHYSATLSTEQTELTADQRESAEILRFNSLPEDEQALLENALPNGSLVSCDTPPDGSPWWSLAHRPERMKVYIEYNGSFYAVWLRITDMMFMDSAEPPGENVEQKVEDCQ